MVPEAKLSTLVHGSFFFLKKKEEKPIQYHSEKKNEINSVGYANMFRNNLIRMR